MTDQEVRDIRLFNRLYTQVIGVVNEHILDSEYSLPEARILFELARCPGLTASELTGILDIDKGYLSRILRRFGEKKLVARVAASDKRVARLILTAMGKREFTLLDLASNAQVEKAFAGLAAMQIRTLVGHMRSIAGIIHQSKIIHECK